MLQPFIDEFLSNLDKTYEAHIKHLPKQVSTQKVGGENGNIDKKKSGFEKQDTVHEINEIFAPNSYDLIDDAEKPYDNKPKEVEKIKYISFKNPNAFFKNWDDQCLELLKLVWSGKIVPFDPVIYDPGHYDKLMQLIINLVKNSQPMFANEVTQKLFIETVHMFIKSLPESIQAKEKSEDIDNSLNYKTNSKEREVNSNEAVKNREETFKSYTKFFCEIESNLSYVQKEFSLFSILMSLSCTFENKKGKCIFEKRPYSPIAREIAQKLMIQLDCKENSFSLFHHEKLYIF